MSNTILQWNCRGYKSNLNEIQILIQEYSPAVISLQETLITQIENFKLKHFNSYYVAASVTNGKAHGGVGLMVRNDIPQREIQLTTNLLAHAVSVTFHKTITICNVYVPPSYHLEMDDLRNLVNQLPKPFLLIGDFNAHNTLWGNQSIDAKGKIVEHIINENNICLFNDQSSTYMHPASGSQTSIDLSICSPSPFMDITW